MQLNTNKTGCISCFGKEAEDSPPGSGLKRSYGWYRILFFFTLFFLLSAFSAQVMAGEPNPKITLSRKNTTLAQVFKDIQRQTQYAFVYNSEMMKDTKRVDIEVKDAPLEQVLLICFKDQPLTYAIVDNIIVVKKRKEEDKQVSMTSSKIVTELPGVNFSGLITDEQNIPISKATIVVKGSNKATATDNYGNFSFSQIPDNATLIITCVGYEKKEISIIGIQSTKLQLKVSASKLDETLVIAYNTTSQRANTGSVTVVKGEQIANLPNRSFDKSLQGLVPGLLVTSGGGQPGSSPANFILRGIATGGNPTLGQSYRNPLVVIDGIPVNQDPIRPNIVSEISSPEGNPLAQLNPSDIETISVLKDASAVSLYGSRASNGVILVTTKKGKAGKTVFTIRSQTDLSTRLPGKIKTLNRDQYLELLYETYRNSMPGITNEQIFSELFSVPSMDNPKFPSFVSASGDTMIYPASDWEGELYKKPLTSSNEISMSGGSDRANYYMNFEYTKQNGVVTNTGYDRKSLRFNFDYRATNWFKISFNTGLSHNLQNYNNDNSFINTMAISPLNPIRNEEGGYIYNYLYGLSPSDYYLVANPVAATKLNLNKNTAFRNISRISGELRFLKKFTITSLLGFDFMNNESKRKIRPELVVGDDIAAGIGSIFEASTRTSNIISTNIFRYDENFSNEHIISLMAGQEAQIQQRKDMIIDIRDISDNPDQEQLYGKTVNTANGSQTKQTMLSYFGQLSYSFKNRYFLTGSLRADGASQFGKNEQFGTYWSTGLGWIVSEEPFFSRIGKFINYLKLRSSFGPSGNSAAILDAYRFDYYSLLRHQNSIAIVPNTSLNPGNPGIKWEQTFTWDAGLEMRLANNRVSLTADFYNRKTTNLIANQIPLPISTGFLFYTDNIGDIRNSGVELAISAEIIKTSHFKWQLGGNWSRNRNKFVKAYYPLQVIGTAGGNIANEVGREYNSFYMPVWAGVNKENGRPQWVDSATGKPIEDYDQARSQFVGKAQPDGFGSINTTFSYKGFELGMMLYYQYGFQVYDNSSSSLLTDGLYPYLNQSTDAMDRWQKPGDIAKNPRRLLYGYSPTEMDMGTYPSTRFLYDGDFIRLSNVQLSYRFPQKLTRQIYLDNLRIYLQANNLATWTKYKGQDPENANGSGQGGVIYPQMRTISIGLNASF